jgi:Rrf2 family nitric oxide-sensitive transcriptional repressor
LRLTTYTDYGLRTLTYLAVHPDGSTVREIADVYGISRNHLVKVVHRLVQEGFVRAARGRSGGIRLGRPAEEIVVGQVVRRMEDDMRLVECFGDGGTCAIQPACVLKGALREALEAFLRVLDGYTLADLSQPSGPFVALLVIPPQFAGSAGTAAWRSEA